MRRRRPSPNALLRRADWRFLLSAENRPSVLSLASGHLQGAVSLICAPATGQAEVVVVRPANRRRLEEARRLIAPDGELYCEWPLLRRPLGIKRARRLLSRCGFPHARFYWPGPRPGRLPQFWLPLESAPAVRYLVARRSRGRWTSALLRWVGQQLAGSGLVWPLCTVARPAGSLAPAREEGPWLLLTGGARPINKVVAVPFGGAEEPERVVKFSRVPEARAGLEREAHALRMLERGHPSAQGAPRVLETFHRAGELGVVESAVPGRALTELLTVESFGGWASAMTDWLIALADGRAPQPRSRWWQRLVDAPLGLLTQDFVQAFSAEQVESVRRRLQKLPDLPIVFEHRDCAPWNVIVGSGGSLTLLDWESAEPEGLPGLDLVYFLANAAFLLDRAFETGGTAASYRRLLDPLSATGAVAGECLARYAAKLSLDEDAWGALRLLCWLTHIRSDLMHRTLDESEPRGAASLSGGLYLGLLRTELEVGA